jgi:hypothetical protein
VLAWLEVHPALDVDGARQRLGALPAYIPRAHDAQLEAVVAAAAAGRSGIAVLVGGSSTGKTRALWEAARQLPGSWRLWHPLSPTRPDAVLAELADIAPRTVVWLNEAQYYLDAGLGEHVAAGLREVLHDPTRGPVLVLATLWPEHWNRLTLRAGHSPHARELLDGHKIDVPNAFTPADLAVLAGTASVDPRLAEAAEHAQDHQVTQYLAGVPVLLDRYQAAQGATRALIHAAMDSRRWRTRPRVPLDWLAAAAPGYLTAAEWNTTGDDWLSTALDYVTEECNGIPGILTPVKTTAPRNQRPPASDGGPDPAVGQPAQGEQGPQYRLADYLDQYGRAGRADQIPPIDFWTAAARHAHPANLTALGEAAWDRGLYRDAAQFRKNATVLGMPYGAASLVNQFSALFPTDPRPVQWVIDHVIEDDPIALISLLKSVCRAGTQEQIAALATRIAERVVLDDPFWVFQLLDSLREAGATEQITVLLARNPAERAVLDDPFGVARLLDGLREAGAKEQFTTLATRAAEQIPLDDLIWITSLLDTLREAGVDKLFATLATRVAEQSALGDLLAVVGLLDNLRRAGADERFVTLAARVAEQISLDDPSAVARLLDTLRDAEAVEQCDALVIWVAERTPLVDVSAVAELLESLHRVGAKEQLTALAARTAEQIPLYNLPEVKRLLGSLREVGADEQFATLAARLPECFPLLLDAYWERFPFGREPDGSAASAWSWNDLE